MAAIGYYLRLAALLALVVLAVLLSGCASYVAVSRQGVDAAAAVADEARLAAEWQLCRAMTVGAWVRAYGNAPERARAWRTLCTEAIAETPAEE